MFDIKAVKPDFFPGDGASLIELNAGVWRHRRSGRIETVVITLSAPESIVRRYFFEGDGPTKGPHEEKNLFRTETDAEAECTERNREERKRRANFAEKQRETE